MAYNKIKWIIYKNFQLNPEKLAFREEKFMAASISKKEAKRFMLYKNGLIGPYKFSGKSGVLEYISQVSPIQYDPVDVCGKSPEITLNSRIKGFKKSMLYELLYKDRVLFDYYDKEMCILLMSDWKYFERTREQYKQRIRSSADISPLFDKVRQIIEEKGPTMSRDIPLNEKVDWYWAATSTSRAVLETLYLQGELIVSHKKNTMKAYDFAHKIVPPEYYNQPEPCENHMEHMKWRVQRRIGVTGLLPNRSSDAFLGIKPIGSANRKKAFDELYDQKEILQISVQDFDEPFYFLASDLPMLEYAIQNPDLTPRCELIAPLDNFIWDRKLIHELFGFFYRWEIYTPPAKRKYAYYTLPVLYGTELIGRIELIRDTKAKILAFKNFWPEDRVKITKTIEKAMDKAIVRLAEMNEVVYERQTKN